MGGYVVRCRYIVIPKVGLVVLHRFGCFYLCVYCCCSLICPFGIL